METQPEMCFPGISPLSFLLSYVHNYTQRLQTLNSLFLAFDLMYYFHLENINIQWEMFHLLITHLYLETIL